MLQQIGHNLAVDSYCLLLVKAIEGLADMELLEGRQTGHSLAVCT